ncbi:retinitis pigmentosa GTPase regulator b isoform X2 [Salvelinus fontinalis]|uniref:retinitis pigmentosa GTPase regulator b isoform X2 n=1 Tax=Salvelinus fontinalis TaxID=8038 RepID=UPI002486C254|nr:retinitis pigmentosa GTPase regulator b isoform X2 [Salvelinus fontinalis]
MAGEAEDEIPETGAVFTFGKSKFSDNVPSKFWLKNDVPLKIACGDEHTALITALKSEKVQLAACGRNHTIVYTSRGNVYSTGGNNEGQLGLGDCEERTAFQLVDFFSSHGPIKMLAAGSNTSAALTESGTLFMWGDNTEGQIGLGKESSALTPREVTVGRPVAWVSCGYYHSAFVTVDGGLYTFGERDSGKLGLATGQLDGHRVPQLVKGITDQVTQVACGGGHTVAVTEDDLYTFGLGQFGQLGQGTFIFEARLPRAVDHFRKGRVRQVMCGENHTAVITDNGLLYTFGDGRHGKLGLGEENFTNQFKPTLCPRFLKYNVQAVTCGGCHMLVLAKPRDESCQEVTLEENDVTEDYLEKSYTELLVDTITSTPATLNSSLSARVRRRERERSPEQFGLMFRTLPPLMSGHLNTSASLPVSSQTIPSSLSPKELTNRKVHNGIHQHRSTESNKKEKRSAEKGRDEGDSSAVENMMDNESVKDLGDTTDFLNMTHVMKMDPSDKTLTLSPVQKRKGKLVKGHGNAGKQPELYTHRRVDPTPRGALPTELLRSSSGRSLVVEKRPRHRAAQGKGSGKENLVVALEAIKPPEPKAGPAKPSSIEDISKAKSKPCPSAQKKQLLAVERKVRERFVMDSKAIQIKGAAKGQSAEVKKTLLEVNPISTKVKSQHVAVRRTPNRKSGRHSQGLKLTDALPVDKTTEPDLVSEVPQKTTNENTEREKSKPKTEPPERTPLRGLLTGVSSLGSGVGLVAARQFGSPSDSESVRSQSRAQRFSRQSAEDAQSSWSHSSASMASEPGDKRTAVRINIIPAPGSSDQGVEEEQCRSYSGPPDNRGQEERRGEESGDETGSSGDQTPTKQDSEGEEEESEGGVGTRRAESGGGKEVAKSHDEVTDEENSEDDDTVKVEEEDGGISELEKESEGGDEQCKTETDQGAESELEDAEKEESGLEEEEEGDGTSSPVGGEGESVGEEEEEEGEGESKEEEESGEVSHSDTESKSKESNYEEEDEEEDGEKEEEGEEEDESVGSVEEDDGNEADSGTEAGEEESSTAEEREEEDKSEEEETEEEEAGEEEETEEEAGEEEESEDEEEAGEEESEDDEKEEEKPGEESEDEEEAGEEEESEDEEEEDPGEEEESEDEEEEDPGEEEESEGEEEEGKEENEAREEEEESKHEEEEEVVDKRKGKKGQESHQNAAARGNGSKQRSGKGEEFWDNVLPQYLNLK